MRAFAQAGAELAAEEPLARFARLQAEAVADAGEPVVYWRARGEVRPGATGSQPTIWLHLQVRASLPLACQRCLGPVDTGLDVDRWFRFVADEAAAAVEDEDSEEDVLALEPRPSLRELIEDELLMELPLVPMHEACPQALGHSNPVDGLPSSEEAPKRHPFAELARLKK